MGLANSFMSLGRIIGPLWAGSMIDVNVVLPYLSGSFVFFGLFIAAAIWLKPEFSRKENSREHAEAISR